MINGISGRYETITRSDPGVRYEGTKQWIYQLSFEGFVLLIIA
jgi:hypothetical protein